MCGFAAYLASVKAFEAWGVCAHIILPSLRQSQLRTSSALGLNCLPALVSASVGRGPFNVRCNALAYGLIDTRLTRAKESGESITVAGKQVALGIPSANQYWGSVKAAIPLKRLGTAEEAAGEWVCAVAVLVRTTLQKWGHMGSVERYQQPAVRVTHYPQFHITHACRCHPGACVAMVQVGCAESLRLIGACVQAEVAVDLITAASHVSRLSYVWLP